MATTFQKPRRLAGSTTYAHHSKAKNSTLNVRSPVTSLRTVAIFGFIVLQLVAGHVTGFTPFASGFGGPSGSLNGKHPVSQMGAALQGLGQLQGQLHQLHQLQRVSRALNVSELSSAGTRVARELSKALNTDVVAVGKALAGAGAAIGSMVFLGGMGALLATGLGAFSYSPDAAAGLGSAPTGGGGSSTRSAKSLGSRPVKKPLNPELVPAINDLMTKVYDVVEHGIPQLLDHHHYHRR